MSEILRTETREFTASPALLRTMILRQAGSLQKAILEGVMNSVDAEATRVEVELDRDELRIRDNGKGMTTEREVLSYFECFGLPHTDDEGKVFGEFRMGRGQLFAYGVNEWRTGHYRMIVDVEPDTKGEHPLHYDLQEMSEPVEGCEIRVQLFEPRTHTQVLDIEKELKAQIRYLDTDVTMNGERITTPPDEIDWDLVTDDAYFLWRKNGPMRFYNLGVHVMERGTYRFGVPAHVVSRVKLPVNFARNDLIEDAPVTKRIFQTLRDQASQETKDARSKKRQYRDYEIRRIIHSLQVDAPDLTTDELRQVPMLRDINGRRLSPNTLASRIRGRTWPLVSLWTKDLPEWKGCRVHDSRMAFVLAPSVAEDFEVGTAAELLQRFVALDLIPEWLADRADPRPAAELAAGVDERRTLVADKDLTERDRMLLKSIRSAYEAMTRAHGDDVRVIRAGEVAGTSGVRAWTDGKTYIALTPSYIKTFDSLPGILATGLLLIHEQTHQEPSAESMSGHTPEFYQSFHDTLILSRALETFTKRALSALRTNINSFNRKMTKKQARLFDQLEAQETDAETARALNRSLNPDDSALDEPENQEGQEPTSDAPIRAGARTDDADDPATSDHPEADDVAAPATPQYTLNV